MSLTVKFNWIQRKGEAPQPLSAASKSRKKLKDTNPEQYQTYLKKDAERKTQDYASKKESMTEEEKEEQRRKWAERKKQQRQQKRRERGRANNRVNIKNMSEAQRREYYTEKKERKSCKRK